VALSGDGNTALIGASSDNNNIGAAFVFTRSGTTWSQQGSKLTGSGEVGAGNFGTAVALSRDGNTALIGAFGDTSNVGAAFVFTHSGTTWSQQGSKLTGSGESGQGQFGIGTALSGDGNTALIGAYTDANNVGAVFVFTQPHPPVITAVGPSKGPQAGGTPITITGTGMTGATSVSIGYSDCTGVVVNSAGTSLTCTTTVHAGAVGSADVVVTTPNGAGTLIGGFIYLATSVPPAPVSRPGGGSGGNPPPLPLPRGRGGSSSGTAPAPVPSGR